MRYQYYVGVLRSRGNLRVSANMPLGFSQLYAEPRIDSVLHCYRCVKYPHPTEVSPRVEHP